MPDLDGGAEALEGEESPSKWFQWHPEWRSQVALALSEVALALNDCGQIGDALDALPSSDRLVQAQGKHFACLAKVAPVHPCGGAALGLLREKSRTAEPWQLEKIADGPA